MDQKTNYTEDIMAIEKTGLLIATDDATYEIFLVVAYLLAAINIFVGILAVLGNGLVLFAAYGNRNNGRLNHLDVVIKSLAVNDLIYGLIGIPCRTINKFNQMWYIHRGK